MYVRALSLRDFRSWSTLDLELTAGTTVFLGANSNGKTNLVEAVGYLASLSSHRVAGTAPLIRSGAHVAFIGATVCNSERELRVDLELNVGSANRARLNRSPVRRPREIMGVLTAVQFAPEDLALVRGDPSDRRRFLDELLVARLPRMAGVQADYERVLRQRSALLKSAGRQRHSSAAEATLDVWDGHLAAHGAVLLAHRLQLTRDLLPVLEAGYSRIAPESRAATLHYRSSLELPADVTGPRAAPGDEVVEYLEATFLHELHTLRAKELERGVCLIGPHRDDLELILGAAPAKGYASHGESWSLALALRLASFELLRAGGTDPVLILDDVFAELDRRRRVALAQAAGDAEQVLVTAAVADDVPAELSAHRIGIDAEDTDNGRLSRLAGQQ